MLINKSVARNLSRLGSRGSFGLALSEYISDNLLVLSADLAITSGLGKFKTLYPDRLINVGIAEQNLLGVSCGLAKDGFNVFCTTFATFATMRSYEMVRLNMGYMKFPIKLIGLAGGFAMGMFGNTHYAVEDIALMRSIPNLTIISPADCVETVKATQAIVNYDKPVYLRLSGVVSNPIVYEEDYNFEIGKSITLKDGNDILILSTGTMVYQSLEASKIIEQKGMSCKVVDIHTIKPLDQSIFENINRYKLVVTVEEHSIINGLGTAVADELVKLSNHPKQLFIGVEEGFKKAGSYKYMLEQNGLTFNQIAEKVLNNG